jgi:hypothetical protein
MFIIYYLLFIIYYLLFNIQYLMFIIYYPRPQSQHIDDIKLLVQVELLTGTAHLKYKKDVGIFDASPVEPDP